VGRSRERDSFVYSTFDYFRNSSLELVAHEIDEKFAFVSISITGRCLCAGRTGQLTDEKDHVWQCSSYTQH
jgi:hypothetical protein